MTGQKSLAFKPLEVLTLAWVFGRGARHGRATPVVQWCNFESHSRGMDASVAVTGYCPHLHRIPAQTHGTGIVPPAKYRDHPFGTSTTKCLQCSGRQAMESTVT